MPIVRKKFTSNWQMVGERNTVSPSPCPLLFLDAGLCWVCSTALRYLYVIILLSF